MTFRRKLTNVGGAKIVSSHLIHWVSGNGVNAEVVCGTEIMERKQWSRQIEDVNCARCQDLWRAREELSHGP